MIGMLCGEEKILTKIRAGPVSCVCVLSLLVALIGVLMNVPAVGGVYIGGDGNVYPSTAPIQRDGNNYIFTDSIYERIEIRRSNITLDGNGHSVRGTTATHWAIGSAIYLSGVDNVTIRNIEIRGFHQGIEVLGLRNSINSNIFMNNSLGISLESSSDYNSVFGNNITDGTGGISINGGSNNLIYENKIENNDFGIYAFGQDTRIYGNNIINCSDFGIRLPTSNDHIYHNNFVNNVRDVYPSPGQTAHWDDGYPSGGNYWSKYNGTDAKNGANQDEAGSDGIGDESHVIDTENRDRYPLMNPWTPAKARVGVKAGDWIEYDYTVAGAPQGTTLPTWIKVEFLSTEGTGVTVRLTTHMSDGTEPSQIMTVDAMAGNGTIGIFSGFIIPANCSTGISVYMSGQGNLIVAGETTGIFASGSRALVHTSLSQHGTHLIYYWDKQTGVMVEASATSGNMTGNAKATKTNMWQAQQLWLPLEPTILCAIAILVIGVAIGTAFFTIRRKKKPPETPVQHGYDVSPNPFRNTISEEPIYHYHRITEP